MKLKILGVTAAAALLALGSTTASAADVWLGLNVGIPAPVVVERRTVHYHEYEPAPVYYEYREYPRYVYEPAYEVRYVERHRHDRGWHRGHHKHHHHR